MQDSNGLFVTQRFTISVSASPVLVAVPDVVGLSQAEAESAVIDAGFSVGNVTKANSDTVKTGHVISQKPAGRTKARSGSRVNLVISRGVSGDVTPPTVEIIAPATDPEVSAPVDIVGTATDTNLT